MNTLLRIIGHSLVKTRIQRSHRCPYSTGKDAPTIHVLGAGAVGLYHAALLYPQFNPVLLTRPPISPLLTHPNPTRTNVGLEQEIATLRIQNDLEGATYRFPTIPADKLIQEYLSKSTGDDSIQHLLVTTKAYDAVSAIEPFIPHWKQLPPSSLPVIILLMNGVLSVHEKIQLLFQTHGLKPSIVLGSTTLGLRRIVEDDSGTLLVHQTGTGTTVFGALNETLTHSKQKTFVNALSNVRQVGILEPETLETTLKLKLIVSSVLNPLAATLNCTNGEIAHSVYGRQLIQACCAEIQQCLALEFNSDHVSVIEDIVLKVALETAQNVNSMLVDVRRGAPSLEWPFLSGHLIQMAASKGHVLPLQMFLRNLVYQIWQQNRDKKPVT